MQDRNRGLFTLVELLVVIAIISVLAGMLLPALSRAVKTARGVACLSNLKGMHLGGSAYADDYRVFVPKIISDPTGFAGYRLWTELASTGNYGVDYGNAANIIYCPSAVERRGQRHHPGYGACFYGPFAWLDNGACGTAGGWPFYPSARPRQLKYPSETILLGDQEHNSYPGAGTYILKNVGSYYTSFVGRHDRHDNLLFADGHARTFANVLLQEWLTGPISLPGGRSKYRGELGD